MIKANIKDMKALTSIYVTCVQQKFDCVKKLIIASSRSNNYYLCILEKTKELVLIRVIKTNENDILL